MKSKSSSKKAGAKKTAKKSTSKATSSKKKKVVRQAKTSKSVTKKSGKVTSRKTAKKSARKTVKKASSKKTKQPAKKATKASATSAGARRSQLKNPTAKKATKRPSRARAGDDGDIGEPKTDFNVPPLRKPLDRSIRGEEYRSILRAPLRDSGLPRRIAHGAVLPALLSDGRNDQLRDHLDWALEERVPAYYLAESLLQSYLFIGFPRTINGLSILHEVNRDRRRSLGLAADQLQVPTEIQSLDRILGGPSDFGQNLKGRRIRLAEGPPMHLESPGEGPGSFERYAREWWRRGSELCRTVYGSQFPRLRENMSRLHPEISDWMIFEGYGKVLSRPIITPPERELWIVPLLMVQNVPEQLFSHLRGAVNLEVPTSRLRSVVWLASMVTGLRPLHEALRQITELEKRES